MLLNSFPSLKYFLHFQIIHSIDKQDSKSQITKIIMAL